MMRGRGEWRLVQTVKSIISLLVGEMSGRTEGARCPADFSVDQECALKLVFY
ncbi:hypothetical protein X734_27205 [Mesorhizobium sp. L2C084A000]|nr:hypothetical protein X734_27205 [Mesorhizobium sp. L2C084A000]